MGFWRRWQRVVGRESLGVAARSAKSLPTVLGLHYIHVASSWGILKLFALGAADATADCACSLSDIVGTRATTGVYSRPGPCQTTDCMDKNSTSPVTLPLFPQGQKIAVNSWRSALFPPRFGLKCRRSYCMACRSRTPGKLSHFVRRYNILHHNRCTARPRSLAHKANQVPSSMQHSSRGAQQSMEDLVNSNYNWLAAG